jgi:hypothetical protein
MGSQFTSKIQSTCGMMAGQKEGGKINQGQAVQYVNPQDPLYS